MCVCVCVYYICSYVRTNECMHTFKSCVYYTMKPGRIEVEHSWLRYVMLSWITLLGLSYQVTCMFMCLQFSQGVVASDLLDGNMLTNVSPKCAA